MNKRQFEKLDKKWSIRDFIKTGLIAMFLWLPLLITLGEEPITLYFGCFCITLWLMCVLGTADIDMRR
jgi:hypothetical protein